jgi:hypothetical protein
MPTWSRQAGWFVGALFAFGGALIATFFAWLTRVNLCEANCHAPAILEIQLIIAVAGLVPAAVLLYATAVGHTRLAVRALAIGILTYAAWGLLNNTAVHGSAFGG